MKRITFNILVIFALVLSIASSASAQTGPTRSLPASVQAQKLETSVEGADGIVPATVTLNRSLVGAVGPQHVIVRLSATSVLQKAVDDPSSGTVGQRLQLRTVKLQQNSFLREARKTDPSLKVQGSVQRVLNAIIITADGVKLSELAAIGGVVSIKPVTDYELDLTTSVPWVGGTAAQTMGYDGTGVSVAIIDSGIDYTHSLLGGSGLLADYQNNDPNVIEPGTFPTAKVVGGYDFVGASWPSGAVAPDPDPLDKPTYVGHGTHVASIAAGLTGMAPGASLYALKVCSSVANSCEGGALIQAIDWIVDPNGNGITDDHMDVANLSLGSSYGQPFDDDLSQAIELATDAGVLVVTSAGNSGDKPYISGSPGATPSALSTAATNNPADFVQLMDITAPANLVATIAGAWQSWSQVLGSEIAAPVQYGNGAGGNINGCTSFPAGSLTGKIVLVNRGTCGFSVKISNIADGGALAGIIGLIAAGDPFNGGFGGGDPSRIPGYMISQADSNWIKSGLANGVTLKLTPGNIQTQGETITTYSSRGPGQFPFAIIGGSNNAVETMTNFIKPEISAPGNITAAATGTGTSVVFLTGTSMASPMVAGSAALVKEARPELSAREIKALLVTSADPNVLTKIAIWGGTLAPVTMQGGGEVRVDRAIMAPAAAWQTQTRQPSLSFDFKDASSPLNMVVIRNVTLRNYSADDITFKVSYTFREAADEATAAVALVFKGLTNGEITVPAGGMVQFPVNLTYNPAALRDWGMNAGSLGGSGTALSVFEYDGFVMFDDVNSTEDDAAPMHLAWHILPRKGGDMTPESSTVTIGPDTTGVGLPNGSTLLTNYGGGQAFVDVYSLVGTSDPLPNGAWGMQSPIIDLKTIGIQTYPVPAGVCSSSDSFVWAFAISTYERTALANYPAEFDVYLDTNQDGTPDFVVFNMDLGTYQGAALDGRTVTVVYNLGTGSTSVFFYVSHITNSSNTVLMVCGEQIGMNAANFYQMVDMSVYAFDNYFYGTLTDAVEGMTVAPMGERFGGIIDGYGYGDLDAGISAKELLVVDWGAAGTNPSEMGLLLINTAERGSISSGAPRDKESTAINVVVP